MLKYWTQSKITTPPPPEPPTTKTSSFVFLLIYHFPRMSENISVPKTWKQVWPSIMCHCVMSLSIIGPHINHVNIEHRYSGKILLWQQIRLHYNKDNLKEPHPLWGWGRGWLVGWVNLNLQIKAAFCNVDVPTNNREKGKERSIWTVSQPSDWGCTWW